MQITVITPSYNQAAYIGETVDSVLNQNYPSLEYLVFDAGSTDGSIQILEGYGDRIHLSVGPDSGQSDAINRGFARATGELIGWQNSDDFYAPGALLALSEAAEKHPEADVFHGVVRGFAGSQRTGPWLFESGGPFSTDTFLKEMCVMNQAMFFRRRIFEEGLFLDEKLHYAMDLEFFWRLVLDGYRFQFVPELQGYYRQHPQAKSNSNVLSGDREIFSIYRGLFHYPRTPISLKRAFRRKLWDSLFSAVRRSRRNLPSKLVPELLWPVGK